MKQPRKNILYPALAGMTTLVGLFVLTSVLKPASPTSPPASVTVQGSRGGNRAAKQTLPTGWPTDVPIPSGQQFGAFGSSPKWGIGVTVNGSYRNVLASTNALYTTNGYRDISGPNVVPYHYDNGSYDIQTAVAAHDHSNTSTDVTVLVHKD